MLAIETLNAAMRKDRVNLSAALCMLVDGQMLDPEELDSARDALRQLENFERKMSELFRGRGEGRTQKLHLAATTLVEEIAVFRESAFWLLDPNGVLDVERNIRALLAIYEHVRRLLRIMIAKDAVVYEPEDPARVGEIPRNRYLALTHPEVCR